MVKESELRRTMIKGSYFNLMQNFYLIFGNLGLGKLVDYFCSRCPHSNPRNGLLSNIFLFGSYCSSLHVNLNTQVGLSINFSRPPEEDWEKSRYIWLVYFLAFLNSSHLRLLESCCQQKPDGLLKYNTQWARITLLRSLAFWFSSRSN